MNELRVYLDPAEIGLDGYPYAWHGRKIPNPDYPHMALTAYLPVPEEGAIKDLIREQAGHRCVRCGHPYRKGEHGNGEWSPCDKNCTHGEPTRDNLNVAQSIADHWREAQWRILTVHHLNGIKRDCRWWNLAALCQRCHLTIQGRVVMERPFYGEHTEWFRPYAAGFYAWHFLGLELTREQTMGRLEELLALEHRQLEIT